MYILKSQNTSKILKIAVFLMQLLLVFFWVFLATLIRNEYDTQKPTKNILKLELSVWVYGVGVWCGIIEI